jgi:hypothetical protein
MKTPFRYPQTGIQRSASFSERPSSSSATIRISFCYFFFFIVCDGSTFQVPVSIDASKYNILLSRSGRFDTSQVVRRKMISGVPVRAVFLYQKPE